MPLIFALSLVVSIGKNYTWAVELEKKTFADKSILVAGGTSGIGTALAQKLLLAGGTVTVIGKPGSLPRGEVSRFIELDLDEKACLIPLAAEAKKADVLCIVRGEFLQKPLHETSAQEWEQTVFSNLVMPGTALSAALSGMKERRWGRILLFGGTRTEAVRGFSTNAVYAAAKTALSSLIRSAAENYGRFGISCTGICPGFVESEHLSAKERAKLKAKIPGGELISPEKIAELALYLLSNFHLNGCIVTADSAWTPQGLSCVCD